tara:strand:- start:3998 stop:7249 length:3252 start_codon:yes stop_codon:yes gene_type:complete
MFKHLFITLFIFTNSFLFAQDFTVTPTDCNMTILIQDPQLADFSLDGGEIPLDALIGVFYTNDEDELTCAGVVNWTGYGVSNIVAAWGAEAGLDNGFQPGEEFTWLLSYEDENGDTQILVASSSTMFTSDEFTDTYACNSFGEVLSIVFSTSCCGDELACNYNDSCETNDSSICEYPETYYNCNGVCINDTDGDEVCDELEIAGCTDITAVNYNILATDDDGSCEYIYYGCTNPIASNYNVLATDDDGSCIFCNDTNADNYYDGSDGSFCSEDLINNYTLETGSDGLADCCFYINPGCTDDGSCFDADGDGDLDECDDRFLYTNEEGESIYYASPFPGIPAVNYNPSANQLIGVSFCYYFPACQDTDAMNYGYNCNGDDILSLAVDNGFSIDFDEEPETESFTITYNGVSFDFEGSNSCCLYYGCDDENASNYQDIDGVFYQNDSLEINETNPNILYEIDGSYELNDPSPDLPPGSNIISLFSINDIDGDGIDNSLEDDPDNDNFYTVYQYGGVVDSDPSTPCVYMGCTDINASNYDMSANVEDGTCIYYACYDPNAINYNPDDNAETCSDYFNNQTYIAGADSLPDCCYYLGCLDPSAVNYNPLATIQELLFKEEDGNFTPIPIIENGDTIGYENTCYDPVYGCLDPVAENYNDYDGDGESNAYVFLTDTIYQVQNINMNDSTDIFSINNFDVIDTIAQPGMPSVLGPNVNTGVLLDSNGNPIPINSVNPCEYIYGCTCPNYIEYYDIIQYNSEVNFDFNSVNELLNDCPLDCDCDFNYNGGCTQLIPPINVPTFDDGSCESLLLFGCTDSTALNYDAAATLNDCLSCISPIDIDLDVFHPICIDNLEGELVFQVSGGVPPYEYSVSNTVTNELEFFNEDLLEGESVELTTINPGEYLLEIIDSGGYSNSVSFPIIMPNDLIIDIWESGGWLNTLDGYDTYEWTLNGTQLIGDQFDTYQIYPVNSGLYGVTVTFEYDDGTCMSDTVYYDYQLFQNTIQDEDRLIVSCIPNPVLNQSVMYVKSNLPSSLTLCLYDGFGKKIWNTDKVINDQKTIVVEGLQAGMYYLYATSFETHQIVPIMVLK